MTRVLWTRGEGCEELAVLLGDTAVQVQGDLRAACLRERADLLVQRRLTSFDLIGSAVPQSFDAAQVHEVVAAVGGGPHSRLAAEVAARIAAALSAPGRVVTAARDADDLDQAVRLLDAAAEVAPDLDRGVIEVPGAADLVASLGEGALLVVGAPGGSWFQRQFFGPGRRLIREAPGGVVVVRSAPRRCFQDAAETAALSPLLPVEEAVRLAAYPVTPVADAGRLVGLVRFSGSMAQGATVGDVMTEPVFVEVDDPIDAVADVAGYFDGSPIPVVDRDGSLYGAIIP